MWYVLRGATRTSRQQPPKQGQTSFSQYANHRPLSTPRAQPSQAALFTYRSVVVLHIEALFVMCQSGRLCVMCVEEVLEAHDDVMADGACGWRGTEKLGRRTI